MVLEKSRARAKRRQKAQRSSENIPKFRYCKRTLKKAEHYLESSIYLKRGNFSDISASTLFYSVYHCFLAIAIKFGYESRNQECTVALISYLAQEGKINLSQEVIKKFASLNQEELSESTAMKIREQLQYGTELSLKEEVYEGLLRLAKETISKTKQILEQ